MRENVADAAQEYRAHIRIKAFGALGGHQQEAVHFKRVPALLHAVESVAEAFDPDRVRVQYEERLVLKECSALTTPPPVPSKASVSSE